MISEPASAVDSDLSQLARLTFQGRYGQVVGGEEALLPPRAQASGTLRRIYESALRLFGERGYHAVSVRDIVRDVGLQASSLYSHVPSKQHLLAELIRIGHEEHRDALRLALLEVGNEPTEQVAALTRAHVLFHASYALLARVCNRDLGALDDEARERVLAIRLESERLFLDVMERGHRLGAFSTPDRTLAVAAVAAMGLRVAEWWHPGLAVPAEHVADTYAEFAVRLLRG